MADGAPLEPDIFLSYAREDEARAGELAKSLEQQGFSVFWDREVPPGETWHSHIGRALVNAKCVVVAWSRHSIVSDWVIEEASKGKRRKVLVRSCSKRSNHHSASEASKRRASSIGAPANPHPRLVV